MIKPFLKKALVFRWKSIPKSHEESIKNYKGRRLDGLTDYSPEEIIDFLVSFVDDPSIVSFMEDQPVGRALKLTADDLKYFYYQAAMARPGNISDIQVGDWFYGETLAGALYLKLAAKFEASDEPPLKSLGERQLIPAHQRFRMVASKWVSRASTRRRERVR